MKLTEKLKRIFRQRPLTPEEIATLAEANAMREQLRMDAANERDATRHNDPASGIGPW